MSDLRKAGKGIMGALAKATELARAEKAEPQNEILKVVEQIANAPTITNASGIKKGSGWSGTKTPDINKLAKKANKFIYHSDVAPNVNELHYGIEPQQGGSWVKEIAHGTGVDNVDEFLENTTPLAWFSDTPSWVKMKVSRHLNKPLTDVTEDDIRKYGHLAIINKKDPGLESIWRVGEQGLSEGPHSKVQTIKGEEIPAYRTDLYQEDYRGNKEPFGVERNEWVSTQPVEPFVQLTGDALIEFLKKSGNFRNGGVIHKADGGKIAKGVMGALTKAKKMAEAEKKAGAMESVATIELPQTPTVVIPSRLNKLKEAVRQSKGDYGARRVERAADEIPNLEALYNEQALRSAFNGDNAKALMTMNPSDFEKYAAPIPRSVTNPDATRHQWHEILDDGRTLTFSEYIDHLKNLKGFRDVPFLVINKEEQGLPLIPFLHGHEGRHRNRAMTESGEQAGLVQLFPEGELREPFSRKDQEEYLDSLKKELGLTDNLVLPEKYIESGESLWGNQIQRPAIKLPDIYADGGKVAKRVMGALAKAKEMAKAEKDANLESFLSRSQVREPVYHATPKDITVFKPGGDDPTMSGRAIWTTTNKKSQPAQHNIGSRTQEFREGVNVMPLHGRAERPLMLDDPGMLEWAQEVFAGGSKEFPELLPDKWLNEVKEAGYDSVILADPYKRGHDHEIIFFEPNQLKSALGNRGTYDIDDPDITKAKGGVIHMADAGRVTKGIMGALTKAKKMAEAEKAEGKMADILESKIAPMTTPQGTGLPLMPRDQGMYTAREQKDLPRMPMVDKARAAGKSPKYNERMQDLLDSPKARKKVDNLMNKGKELNIQEWYGTEPLRQVAMDLGRTPEQFNSMMAQLASASQRNPVDKQNQMGSYLYHLAETGQLPENAMLLTNKLKEALKADPSLAEGRTLIELPKGYGSLAQGDIFDRAVQIGQGDIGGALPPNKKLGTFYENLLGNLRPVTVDVNALRGPVIEQGDPRWLTSKLVEKDDKGKIINTYQPRKMVETGEMTVREAQQRPGFWEAAPSGSEYAGFEDLWQRGAKRHGVEPAEAQALGWYGSGVPKEGDNITALKTKPENYVDNLERLIRETAQQTGKSPKEVMSDMITGKGFLRKEGGSVNKPKKPHWYDDFHRKMAQGGVVFTDKDAVDNFLMVRHKAEGGDADDVSVKDIARNLGKLAKEQGKEELSSLKKPRAVLDIGNRGILAPALGSPVDLINMGLGGIDALTAMSSNPTRLASEKPFGGQEHIKELMDSFGITSGEDRPMIETTLSFFSPTGMIKGAQKSGELAKKLPGFVRKIESGLASMSKKP
jgi:hypothetical protein